MPSEARENNQHTHDASKVSSNGGSDAHEAYLMTRRTSKEVECYSEDEDLGAVRPEQAVPEIEAEVTTMEAGPSREDAIDFEHGVAKKWHIPDMLKGGAPVKLGIDEAGRGPVLGPMVYAAAFWKVDDDAAMCALGFNDSKALDDKQRQRLFKRMRNTPGLGWIIHCLHATELSGKMLRREPCSLNIVSHDAAAELVSLALAEGVCVTEVYVDTVGDPEMYQRKLEGLFEHHTPKIKMTVSKKADSLFKTVSAASIAAKVTRDRVLATWAWEEVFAGGTMPQRDFGSGYPSDPRAAEWMKHNSDPVFGFTSLVRFSWSTAREFMEKQCVSVQWDAEADDLTLPIGTASIESFLKPKPGVKRGRNRAKFFQSRGLALVSDM